MTIIEGFTIGLLSGLVGCVISYLEIKTIFLVAGPNIAMSPNLDISTFIFAGVMGIVITLIGVIAPLLKGKQIKIVEVIKCE